MFTFVFPTITPPIFYSLFLCSCQRPRYSQPPVWRPCLCLKRMSPSPKDRGGSLIHFISLTRAFQQIAFPGSRWEKNHISLISLFTDSAWAVDCAGLNTAISAWHLTWYLDDWWLTDLLVSINLIGDKQANKQIIQMSDWTPFSFF